MNQMTRQSVINTIYATLRNPSGTHLRHDILQVAAMLHHLDVTFEEIEIAAKKFGDTIVEQR